MSTGEEGIDHLPVGRQRAVRFLVLFLAKIWAYSPPALVLLLRMRVLLARVDGRGSRVSVELYG